MISQRYGTFALVLRRVDPLGRKPLLHSSIVNRAPVSSAQGPLRRDRLFCIEESVWDDKLGLTDQMSVLPTLELLRRMRVLDQFVHRHALGVREFENYLTWRPERRTRTYGTIYLAFHGNPTGLEIGDEIVHLDRLAGWLGQIPGAVVHLGSCSVLKGNEDTAARFLKATGARLISGYDRDVEWLDSAALETAWLGYLASYARVGDAVRNFRRRYGSLVDYLTWVSYQ